MKATFVLAALAVAVAGQTTADIPSCALQCLATSITGAGCSVEDQACSCEKTDAITTTATPCVLAACSIDDALKTQQVTQAICANLSNGGGQSSAAPSAPASSEAPAPSEAPSSEETPAPTPTPTPTPTGSDEEPTPTSTPPTYTGAAARYGANIAAGVLAVGAAML
ncbi:hypothetical protein EJ05DRAFT_374171 [Pseudovirgaria hyperparasitica]|uniref:CFEM domain-containing protein n=1 Tax=Pseudovirgaria hyperparasitica TaxID=470096 RepID=A0A6A6W561_9PEZI|nr:uncharacterized protein EJ05DRAFT_374171 [Pseudovirgaria hyperparasitica]KAF2758012.1 hypothetical protein EJ05DRAFT_374171 [Pseudovirgaria hyperparasitica]